MGSRSAPSRGRSGWAAWRGPEDPGTPTCARALPATNASRSVPGIKQQVTRAVDMGRILREPGNVRQQANIPSGALRSWSALGAGEVQSPQAFRRGLPRSDTKDECETS